MTHNDLRYEFGPYQLNPSKRILTRDGEGIPLTFVEEANLSQNIFTLRRALGDDRTGPKYIETIARRGYRFTRSVKTIGVNEHESEDFAESDNHVAKRPLVVVLPFNNSTGAIELNYLADGLTHNLANIDARRNGIAVNVELVDVAGGWQLWGETFDSESKDLLEIQESITRHLLAALKLRLTGAEEKKITARYTHFCHAFKLDPNYALAYAAVVDCYLRLATNYLPPEENGPAIASLANDESDQIELRFEWDCRNIERELRRAADLKTDYSSPHQWLFVYRISKQLYEESSSTVMDRDSWLASQIPSVQLTPTEEVQVLCCVARDQIAIGNFEAARLILKRGAVPRKWPRLASLNPYAAVDLLFTLGTLFGSVGGTRARQSLEGTGLWPPGSVTTN